MRTKRQGSDRPKELCSTTVHRVDVRISDRVRVLGEKDAHHLLGTLQSCTTRLRSVPRSGPRERGGERCSAKAEWATAARWSRIERMGVSVQVAAGGES